LDICGFDLETNYKSEFMPVLSDFEKTLVFKKKTKDWEIYNEALKSLFDKLGSEKEFKISKEHFNKNGISFSIEGGRKTGTAWFSITFVEVE